MNTLHIARIAKFNQKQHCFFNGLQINEVIR